MAPPFEWTCTTLFFMVMFAAATAGAPSRLSMDFSSSLIVESTPPASVLARMDALLADMASDGVNNLCSGRADSSVCNDNPASKFSLRLPLLDIQLSLPGHASKDSSCSFCMPPAPATGPACNCTAPSNTTRCTCYGKLTGAQYFDAQWYGVELAHILVEAVGESNTVTSGVMNANFNSTVRLSNSKLFIARAAGAAGEEGGGDLELDESQLDLLDGSELHLIDDGDLEVEDAGSLWMAGKSKIVCTTSSNIQTQLAHVLVEGESSILIDKSSEWNVTQEFDFTPVAAASVCDHPFKPNPEAEYCFSHKEECMKRLPLLSGPQKQALGMLKYPPALDRWGRQAFDYADDDVYDDYYDVDYKEPELEAGACLGPDVCDSTAQAVGQESAPNDTGSRRHRRALLAPTPAPAPLPAGAAPAATAEKEAAEPEEAEGAEAKEAEGAEAAEGAGAEEGASAADSDNDGGFLTTTEINAFDTLDGKGYDPSWGEGPYGETLCDAPPFRAFNYYGIVIRGGSSIRIASSSTWTLFDQSRVFIKDSTITLEDDSKLHLMNSTVVLINSTLVVKGGSQIIMEQFSGLHLFASKVLGDNALYAVPAGSTWGGKAWLQRGDYRASPGGGLPVSMGAQAGAQIGTYPMRVFGFGLEARMMPAAGCNCKKPKVATYPSPAVTGWPERLGWETPLEGLL